jgi:hypothetical protein
MRVSHAHDWNSLLAQDQTQNMTVDIAEISSIQADVYVRMICLLARDETKYRVDKSLMQRLLIFIHVVVSM